MPSDSSDYLLAYKSGDHQDTTHKRHAVAFCRDAYRNPASLRRRHIVLDPGCYLQRLDKAIVVFGVWKLVSSDLDYSLSSSTGSLVLQLVKWTHKTHRQLSTPIGFKEGTDYPLM